MSKYYIKLERRTLDYKTKKRRRLIRNSIITSIIISAILIFSLIIYPNYKKNKKNDPLFIFNNCNYDAKEFNESLTFKEEIKIMKDYYFYGESLALYDDTYINDKDAMSGSLVLVDICKQKEYRFRTTSQIDANIRLGKLEKGFYQLFVDLNGIRYQIATEKPLVDSIYTITRNNINYLVTLFSTKQFFEKDQPQLNYYTYIDIREEKSNDYDIILDPGGNYASNDLGFTNNQLKENEMMYQASLYMKEALESNGLKVKIIREEDEIIDLKSRVKKAYEFNAKIIISNRVTKHNNTTVSGFHVYYPKLSSGGLASSVINTVSMQKRGNNGLFTMSRTNNPLLDFYIMNRETGAKATQSVIDEETLFTNQKGNKGMDGLLINHLFISNDNDVNYWNENQTKHLDEVVNAILNYLDIQ